MEKVGLFQSEFSADQTLFGILHVDDSFVVSRIYCQKCIETGVCQIFPKDCGMAVEDFGTTLKLLSAIFDVSNPDSPIVIPYFANTSFILGHTQKQKFCRLGEFVDSNVTTKFQLKTFVLGQLLLFDRSYLPI